MKILIAGDFCPQSRVADILGKGNFNSIFCEGVQKVINDSDYSIVNFECPVISRDAVPIAKLGPNLKCELTAIDAIKFAGFDCVTLANNHFFDYGLHGVEQSLTAFNEKGIDHVGGGLSYREASRILYRSVKRRRLAIINCCEHEFSAAKGDNAGCNILNPISQYYAIKEARKNADKVIVIVHGGYEHFQLPSIRMVDTYRFFIDSGADAVVNHHQHCFSGYEYYHNGIICYGLGNFCFDHPTIRGGLWTEGLIVTLDFSDDKPTLNLHHIKQCAEEASVSLLTYNDYDSRLRALNRIISDTHLLEIEVNKYFDSCANQYSRILEPIQNRLYLAAKKRGWLPSFISKSRFLLAYDYIFCESHRDKLMRWLDCTKER